jgi:UDPglucose 6-dehydrogenase
MAFGALARSLGAPCEIAEATDRINDQQVHRLLGAVGAVARPGARVALLGLSYKLHTSVVEQSQGMALGRQLLHEGYRVVLADPLAAAPAAGLLGPSVEVAPGFQEAIASADAAVITTPWPDITRVAPEAFARPTGPLPVIDPWGLLKGTPLADAARLILLGRGAAQALVPDATALARSGSLLG